MIQDIQRNFKFLYITELKISFQGLSQQKRSGKKWEGWRWISKFILFYFICSVSYAVKTAALYGI
jgi:hypothetical protein